MRLLTLFVDTSSNQLLTSLNNATVVSANNLPFFVGDSGLMLQVFLLIPILTSNPNLAGYTIIPTTGIALQVYLDNGEYNTDVIYTQQVNFQSDANSQYFYAQFPMNTVALENLLGSSQSAPCFLHIGYLQGGETTTVLLEGATIQAGIPDALAVVPAPLTPLSQQAADQRYVPFIGQPGVGFILTTKLGKQIYVEAVDNADGTSSLAGNPMQGAQIP